MSRQKLIHWFETAGKEIVETSIDISCGLKVGDKVEVVKTENREAKKVGQIEVVKVTPRKGAVNGS